MKPYRRIPTRILAEQLTVDNIEEMAFWCNGGIKGTSLPLKDQEIEITGDDIELRAEIGDYIVCEADGEFHPCKPDKFRANYERLAD